MSSFGHPDTAIVVTPVPTGQPVKTNQVPTHTATNIRANVTSPLVNSTKQDACDHPTCHEWVWF